MTKSVQLYIGGYKGQNTHCLFAYSYDSQGDVIEEIGSYDIANASYLCFSPNRKYLYTVAEADNYQGQPGGGIAAFAVENNGSLRFINDCSTGGASPCHLSVSPDGKTLYTANYSGGSTVFFELLPTGGIGEKKVFVNHHDFGTPSRAHPGRQENPHAHYIQPLVVDGKLTIWTCDLGLDAVLVLDESGAELARFNAPAGFGPRHLAFHPTLPIAYALGELSCSVITLSFGFDGNATDSTLIIEGSREVRTLDSDVKSTCAAIRVSHDGKYVLASNRSEGEGSIAVLGLDASGNITGLEKIVPSDGSCPRDFSFNLAGNKVLVAHQDSDNVVVFDWADGELTRSGTTFEVQRPTCVLM